ncbi:Fimbrial assembly [Candidatus Thiomargarita nelsonii]|uniref:Fimbrial assembly n=1 Tax=Candidatus Thiomargarita nelsonii TaxID=1003181 RepID=A0A0A6P1G7_9GAMM|nr:Fimbrial assembly [Candidatus Thiomargarita nelsonii]
MPHINLLPWRETLKKERETRFFLITGMSLLFMGIVVILVHLYMVDQIDYQQRRNHYLKSEIKKVEAQLKEIETLKKEKKRLIERMDIIQELEESRSNVVHLFDELVKQVPNGVYFTSMKQKGNQITLEGVAQSGNRVSELMENLEASQWLTNPKIYSIKTIEDNKLQKSAYKKRRLSHFKLEITQTAPTKKDNSP